MQYMQQRYLGHQEDFFRYIYFLSQLCLVFGSSCHLLSEIKHFRCSFSLELALNEGLIQTLTLKWKRREEERGGGCFVCPAGFLP